jgi:hypothetical protein
MEAIPAKERVQASRDLIADRLKSLQAGKERSEAMPKKEHMQVSLDLISDRVACVVTGRGEED